jgi:hypothetical protein
VRDFLPGLILWAVTLPVYGLLLFVRREKAPDFGSVMAGVAMTLWYGFLTTIGYLLLARFFHMWPFSN